MKRMGSICLVVLLSILALLSSNTVPAGAAVKSTSSSDIRQISGARDVPDAAPNCGKGVRPRKVVATYKAKRYGTGGYRTDTLYCGNGAYGYRHLQPHIGQYFGGWATFSFSIAQVLKAPAKTVVQANGNYLKSAPIYQCFFAGYYVIWTFYVVPNIKSGSIVTAYGRRGKTVNRSCP
jgi:hypothetical protein